MLRAEFSEDDISRFGDQGNDGSDRKAEDPIGKRMSVDEMLSTG